MAFEDYDNQVCLCAWLGAMGEGPKQQLKIFVTTARTILEAAKVMWLLINTDWEDIGKKEAAELALKLYQQVTDPIEAPIKYLVSLTAPFADCPPVATIASTVKQVGDVILDPVEELEYEIQKFIEAIEINQAKAEYFDMLIGNMDDILDAIEQC